jgi:molybdopterin molybdotransferase
MISVSEATQLIHEHLFNSTTEEVPLQDSTGRVLREDLIADRDFPPFNRVTMDGIAIDFAAWKSGARKFNIQEIAPAGKSQARLLNAIDCIEIMTGAILPEGCDTVIRYEDLGIKDGVAEIIIDDIQQGKNVHGKGTDRKTGDIIVRAGTRISGPEIGVAATIGKSNVRVAGLPRIAVISTGDELVDISETPLPHQIRKSNVVQIAAVLRQYGVQLKTFHISDDQGAVEDLIRELISGYDCLILSGGVSAGKFDYVPEALDNLGVQKIFHKVAQRPGKPFWFGVKEERGGPGSLAAEGHAIPGLNKRVVFALPGNPVSSFMCTLRYVIPWLKASQGIVTRPEYAILTKDFHFKPPLTYFLQVKLAYSEDGMCYATPTEGHGSGDLANLVEADGFLELEAGHEVYGKGEGFRVWRCRSVGFV